MYEYSVITRDDLLPVSRLLLVWERNRQTRLERASGELADARSNTLA